MSRLKSKNPINFNNIKKKKSTLKRVPFTLSIPQSNAMTRQMFEVDQYKLTEKSKWINEAIAQLLSCPHWLNIVEGVMLSQREGKKELVTHMGELLKLDLDEACIDLKRKIILGEVAATKSIISAVIRGAIMNRLDVNASSIANILSTGKHLIEKETDKESLKNNNQ
ncbi:MAG: hypothetical protein QM500_19430 [Methylococcales bacterium]